MKKLIKTLLLLMISFAAFSQESDTLKHFAYLYKGQPMPFDSGVAIDDPQYQFLLRNSMYQKLDSRITNALKPVPKIVYVEKEVRKKGDGNILTWFFAGGGAIIIVEIIIKVVVK